MKKYILISVPILIFSAVVGYWYLSSIPGEQVNKKHTIVIVDPGGEAFTELFRSFQESLLAAHTDSAESLLIVYKNAAGSREKLKQFISEAVAMNPALIATVSSPPTLQALEETKESKIPIIAVLGDPTKHGYIKSLQSSDTNLTGIAQQSIELTPKRFEILKELAPKVKRVAVFYDTTCGPTKEARPIANASAPKLGLVLKEFPLTNPSREDLEKALGLVNTKDFDAIMFYPHGTLFSKSDIFLAKANELKLPIVMPEEAAIKGGAIASFGPSYFSIGKQLARQAEKILKGIDPKDIPFEQADNIQLIVGIKNAKFLGIDIPTTVLERADKIVNGQ